MGVGGAGHGQAQAASSADWGERGITCRVTSIPSKPAFGGKNPELGEDAEGFAIHVCGYGHPAGVMDKGHRLVQAEGTGVGEGCGLGTHRTPFGVEQALVSEEGVITPVGRRSSARSRADTLQAASMLGKRPSTCTSSTDVISMPSTAGLPLAAALTAATLPAELWSETAIMSRPTSKAVATMAGGVISSEAQGESAVWMCRSARYRFN